MKDELLILLSLLFIRFGSRIISLVLVLAQVTAGIVRTWRVLLYIGLARATLIPLLASEVSLCTQRLSNGNALSWVFLF